MFFARLKVFVQTLRFRLMLWNMGVILLSAGAMLVGLREGIRRTMVQELDQTLTEDLKEIELGISQLGATPDDIVSAARTGTPDSAASLLAELDRKAQGHADHDWFVTFVDESGRNLWSSVHAPAGNLDLPVTGTARPVTRDGLRILQRRVLEQQVPIVVRVGISTAYMEREMGRVDRLAMIAAGLALVTAPLGGYWVAGRAVRLLHVISNTASRLRPRQLNERLPIRNTGDELDQMSQTINGLLDRIAAYINQGRDFIANSAHELRTPLAAIRSTVEVAMVADRSHEEYRELLATVVEECGSLEILVNQLLLLSESEADRLETHGEFVNLSDIVGRSCEMFRGVAEARDIELRVHAAPGIMVEGNAHHLRQVLNNLLDNAIKFTNGGQVDVELEVDAHKPQIVLRVSDTGVGIPPEDLGHVFERFFRGDRSRSRDKIQGTGLGLSICETVVRAHRGELFIQSDVHKGTQVTVILPLASPDRTSPLDQEASDGRGSWRGTGSSLAGASSHTENSS